MDVLEAILTRRSIRRYTGQPVQKDDLDTILRAGSQAPSAMNRQPWQFIVVTERAGLESIAKFHPFAKMLPQAGCCIVVCGDKIRQPATGFLVEDCSAAIQNMLLAAHGLGLGAVWCGLHPVTHLTRSMSRLLHLPAVVMPVGLLAVGHKAEEKPFEDRYDPAKVHYEHW